MYSGDATLPSALPLAGVAMSSLKSHCQHWSFPCASRFFPPSHLPLALCLLASPFFLLLRLGSTLGYREKREGGKCNNRRAGNSAIDGE